VSVKEYQSQLVRVAGEVVRPGTTPLKGATRLLDALLAAGGLTKAASGAVVVERREGTFADGSTVKRLFLAASPDVEALRDLETPLHPRDVIIAGKTWYVRVTGAVVRPGRYPLRQGTLSEALSAAGGTTRSAAGRARVSRVDPQTGKAQVLDLDIEGLKPGRDADPALFADDEVTVPRRRL
jgi:protein involved in polysaccharide export with SLBB domain